MLGCAWTGPTAGSGTLVLVWQTISWSSSIYVWILWLESHMFAVAGSQKTVQMQWVIPVYCSVLVISLYWNCLFNLDLFLCIWGKETLFQFSLLWRKYQIFLFTRTKVLKSGCWTTLRYPCRKLFTPSYHLIYNILFIFPVFSSFCVTLCAQGVLWFPLPVAFLFLLQLLSPHCCMENMCWISS